MKGRKRTPDHLKVVKGTARPDRVNPDSPVASIDSPRPPTWLSRTAVEYFGVLRSRLEGMELASSADTETLAMAATRLAEIEECNDLINEHGRLIESRSEKGGVMIRTNPAVTQRNEAMRHLQSLLAEFGMTPAARSKVSVPGSKKKKNSFAKASSGK